MLDQQNYLVLVVYSPHNNQPLVPYKWGLTVNLFAEDIEYQQKTDLWKVYQWYEF